MLIESTQCECGMDRESMTYKKKRCYGKECKKSSRQKGRYSCIHSLGLGPKLMQLCYYTYKIVFDDA